MPKHVKARAAQDEQEERQVRKLAKSPHAPAEWKFHAQMVLLSWAGKTPNEIAAEPGCHRQTVRIHLKRFTLAGVTGPGRQSRRSFATTRSRPRGRRPSAPTNAGQSFPAPSRQRPAGLPMGTASKRSWMTVVVPSKPGSLERCGCAMARN